jgi:ribosome-binding factor A
MAALCNGAAARPEMPRKKKSSATPGQRPLRVGEEVRHALAHILTFEIDRLDDPDLYGKRLTVTEVRISPDLRSATAFVVPLGATVAGFESAPLIKALNRAAGFFRGLVAQDVKLQFSPTLRFKLDESFDEASRIQAVLHDPAVARDLVDEDEDDLDADDLDELDLPPPQPSPESGEGDSDEESTPSPSPDSGEGGGGGESHRPKKNT